MLLKDCEELGLLIIVEQVERHQTNDRVTSLRPCESRNWLEDYREREDDAKEVFMDNIVAIPFWCMAEEAKLQCI
jgi:hypothetical protein